MFYLKLSLSGLVIKNEQVNEICVKYVVVVVVSVVVVVVAAAVVVVVVVVMFK